MLVLRGTRSENRAPGFGETTRGSGEFDAVICGKRYLNNDLLIGQNEHAVQRMCAVDEDFMYVVFQVLGEFDVATTAKCICSKNLSHCIYYCFTSDLCGCI